MLIYSIMPMDTIFPPERTPKTFRPVRGGILELDSENKIQRIISTDLKKYLDYNIGDLAEKS
ncbi:MAG: hypothetical protein IJE10_08135 [Clostridia bacterium]|nr:hypothetical protein [Clostridia bacterium]